MNRLTLRSRILASLAGVASILLVHAPLFAAPGDVDTTFSPPATAGGAYSVTAVQADGRIIIANNDTNIFKRYFADGSLDSSFSSAVSGAVRALSISPDGKIWVGGNLTLSSTPVYLVRLNSDGSLDTNFPTNIADSTVISIARRFDGKIYIGGQFNAVTGLAYGKLALLNPDGSTDTSFSPTLGGYVTYLAPQPDGKVVVVGQFDIRTVPYIPGPFYTLARFNADGTLDVPGPAAPFYHLPMVLKDGSILAVQASETLIQLDSTLTPTGLSWNAGAGSTIASIVLQEDSKMILGGTFSPTYGHVVRLTSSWTRDLTFRPTFSKSIGIPAVTNLILQNDGKVLVTGLFDSVKSVPATNIARLENSPAASNLTITPSGSNYDLKWSRSGSAPTVSFADFEVSVNGGHTWTALGAATPSLITPSDWVLNSPLPVTGILRISGRSQNTTSTGDSLTSQELEFTPYSLGALDLGFNPNSSQVVYATAQQPDGKNVIGGIFGLMGGVSHVRLARVNLDGTLDSTFNPTVSSEVHAILIQPDGKIVIGGEFGVVNGVSQSRIARLNANGTLDTTFAGSASSNVHTLALQPDGKILLGGEFTQVNGIVRNRIARLNSDGSLDMTFNPNASSSVRSIALQDDGKIIVGGVFTLMSGITRHRIARLNSDGTLDTSFAAAPNSTVLAVAVQADGKILLGGLFTAFPAFSGSYSRPHIARLDSSGNLDMTFANTVNDNVYGITLQADGKIYIYGHFTTVGGTSAPRCARLKTNGLLDTTMNPGASSYVYSAMLQADAKLVIAGQFTSVQSTTRNRVARLHNDLPNENLRVISSSKIQWMRGGGLPEAVAVWFETSTDGGVTWSNVGNGTRISGGWELSGAILPTSGQLRGRAITRGGKLSGSNGICEVVTTF